MMYVALLRGINVGGKNKVSMAELKTCLEDLGFKGVRTYIASGNVLFETDIPADKAAGKIENILPKKFKLDSSLIKVLILSRTQLKKIVGKAPKGYGQRPDKYHSDVVFLIGKSSTEAMEQVKLRPDVDKAWAGEGVVYFQRLSAQLTKSRINKIASTPIYQFMTLRTWNTARKLADLMQEPPT
jgi:uncharacterized protein (DUF1697 family)